MFIERLMCKLSLVYAITYIFKISTEIYCKNCLIPFLTLKANYTSHNLRHVIQLMTEQNSKLFAQAKSVVKDAEQANL